MLTPEQRSWINHALICAGIVLLYGLNGYATIGLHVAAGIYVFRELEQAYDAGVNIGWRWVAQTAIDRVLDAVSGVAGAFLMWLAWSLR